MGRVMLNQKVKNLQPQTPTEKFSKSKLLKLLLLLLLNKNSSLSRLLMSQREMLLTSQILSTRRLELLLVESPWKEEDHHQDMEEVTESQKRLLREMIKKRKSNHLPKINHQAHHLVTLRKKRLHHWLKRKSKPKKLLSKELVSNKEMLTRFKAHQAAALPMMNE